MYSILFQEKQHFYNLQSFLQVAQHFLYFHSFFSIYSTQLKLFYKLFWVALLFWHLCQFPYLACGFSLAAHKEKEVQA